ncbi:MAG: baseplate assembly protein [Sphingomonadales bacterium 63-6]|nr:MAG: baseplate assembly protein [Sphingomonadales bacterium 63-6]
MIGLDRNTGKAIASEQHLAQSIGDILTTPIGTRVERRDYGSMLFELLDQPLNGATRLLTYAATAFAIRRWEPRIRVQKVGLAPVEGQPGQAVITIEGERTDLPAANERIVLSIPIRAGGVSPVPVT